ncbi:hypothetical protein [Streptomyces sp. CC228A]|uniref:hypothetical protein n=1 Tax=Streptomyces sp. CC228A TaxID=2898186 RepID=UPI001F38DC50|nr:hypothetical protein [Streptomyces sp. CC228A]
MPSDHVQSPSAPAALRRSRTAALRRSRTAAVGVLVALGLTVSGCGLLGGGSGDRPAAASLPPETARPGSAPPEEVFPDAPTVKEPFRGSPALRWADGAAGIEVPEAKAVGSFSPKQVAHALAAVKELLVEANITPATLRGEHPKAALDLLDPLQKDGRGLMEGGLRKPTKDADPVMLFSRFDPTETRVLRDLVKTRGRITYEKGESDGELLIRADFSFVYPVVKVKTGEREVDRSVIRRELTFALYDPEEYETTPGKLFMVEWAMSSGNDDCNRAPDGFLHPTFPSDRIARPDASAAPSGEAVDPYDRSKSLDDMPQECAETTRG